MFGVIIFSVFADIALLLGRLNARRNLRTLFSLKVVQLFFELFQALFRQKHRFIYHLVSLVGLKSIPRPAGRGNSQRKMRPKTGVLARIIYPFQDFVKCDSRRRQLTASRLLSIIAAYAKSDLWPG